MLLQVGGESKGLGGAFLGAFWLLHPRLTLLVGEGVNQLLFGLLCRLGPHPFTAGHDEIARGVHQVIVLLQDPPVIVALIKPELSQPVAKRAKQLHSFVQISNDC